MASKAPYRTTFEVAETIRPFYTGGGISLDGHGNILATALGEDSLLTDLDSGRQLSKIEGDGELISTLTLTSSASHLIVCSRSLSLRIYSLRSSPNKKSPINVELLRTLKPHTTPVIVLAVDKTDTLFATGAADGNIKVWDIRGGYVTHMFKGPNTLISALNFFELKAVSKQQESTLSARNIRLKRDGLSEKGTQNEVLKGLRLASGSQDGKVRIWDLYKQNCASVLESHISDVTSMEYSPDLNIFLTASRDKTIMWWDSKTWKIRKVIPVLEEVECAGFLEMGEYTYTGGINGHIRIWRTDDGREVTQRQSAKAETDAIVKAMFCKDFIFSVRSDHTMAVHSIAPLKNITSMETISCLPVIKKISGTHDEIIDLGYLLPDRSLLALATNTEEIRIVSLGEVNEDNEKPEYFGADVAQLVGHNDIVICLDTDWSGHWISTGAKDNTARLWRIDATNSSFVCYTVLTGHAESVGAISLPHQTPPESSSAFKSPLEHPPPFIITGSQDQTIKKWDISKLQSFTATQKAPRAIYTRKAHDKDINAIDVNYNSQLFASASQDKTVKIWDVNEGEVQGVLRGHKRGVWSVKFAPQDIPSISNHSVAPGGGAGKGLILTGSGDKTVKIWSLSDYSCLRTFEGHSNSVLKVCWLALPKSEERKKYIQITSAGGDGLVKVWDVHSGEVACTLDNHEDRVWALTVNPDTNMIISGSGDSTVTFWRDTSASTQAATTAAAAQLVEQEQELENYINSKSYREAITLALQLNHPGRLLALFKSVVTTATPEPNSLCGLQAVDDVLSSLSDNQIYILLLRLRDWNTNARTAPIAQKIFWTLVKIYPSSRLSNLKISHHFYNKKLSEEEEIKEKQTNHNDYSDNNAQILWNAIKIYSEKHYKKLDELIDASYLLEYTLSRMDTMDSLNDEENKNVSLIGTSPPHNLVHTTKTTNSVLNCNNNKNHLDCEGDFVMMS
ncbi:putative U3 small nucleolar RNA-associated protein 13 [Golovinomyces cichoracearum]|uniref:Putative U3 small nucleolar RNA-associated protein 13 n=1 Tax=Golovinomyces cichoracearum TaxID=62708 RepID=A0A420HGP8_9PEZI|nr:putative U3 small nucleolar RNA-associated protein 13 [Golovinomyces cichoracearum]